MTHYITSHHITLCYITVASRHVTLHYATLRYITLRYTALTLHYGGFPQTALHQITSSNYITSPQTSRYITCVYIPSHRATLQRITRCTPRHIKSHQSTMLTASHNLTSSNFTQHHATKPNNTLQHYAQRDFTPLHRASRDVTYNCMDDNAATLHYKHSALVTGMMLT